MKKYVPLFEEYCSMNEGLFSDTHYTTEGGSDDWDLGKMVGLPEDSGFTSRAYSGTLHTDGLLRSTDARMVALDFSDDEGEFRAELTVGKGPIKVNFKKTGEVGVRELYEKIMESGKFQDIITKFCYEIVPKALNIKIRNCGELSRAIGEFAIRGKNKAELTTAPIYAE